MRRTARQMLGRVLTGGRRARNLRAARRTATPHLSPIEPVWPLPRAGWADAEIAAALAAFPGWHYDYRFEDMEPGPSATGDAGGRPLQRFRHFMPAVMAACGGSLAGKRVLDVACNGGFWSIQCGLLGAREVIGFDARQELVDQADLVRRIVGLDTVSFRRMDYWDLSPERLGGRFDLVLHLGVLYHLPKPLEAMELARTVADDVVLLDTAIDPSRRPVVTLNWEVAGNLGSTASTGVVAYPSGPALDLILRHAGYREWARLPLRSPDMPEDYLTDLRASWLIRR